MAKAHNPKSRQEQPAAPSCATCAHVSRIENDDKSGYCRRYPPSLKIDGVSSSYIPVKLEWRCGEYSLGSTPQK